MQLTSVLCI